MRFRRATEGMIRVGRTVWVKNNQILDSELQYYLSDTDQEYAKAIITELLPSRDGVVVKFYASDVRDHADGEGGEGHNYTKVNSLYTLMDGNSIFDKVDNKIGSFPGR